MPSQVHEQARDLVLSIKGILSEHRGPNDCFVPPEARQQDAELYVQRFLRTISEKR